MRIVKLLVGDGAPELASKRLCAVCAEVTGLTGAGIMLMSDDVPYGSLCNTNAVSALVEQLQYTLGEGPCIDAFTLDRAVAEPDLADPRTARWLAFSGPALTAGVRAVFAFPMQVGSVRLGALDVYRDRPGALTHDQHADALVMADVAAQAVLVMQAKAPPGLLAAALESGANLQLVVHQASGMVAVQLDVSVGRALVRLRAYAFAHDRELVSVARDVVDRALRFDDRDGAST